MLERKFIKPSIFQITQTSMGVNSTTPQEFFYARRKNKWYRVSDDKLETAVALVKGENPKNVRELTRGELMDLETRHLVKSENREVSIKW